MDKIYKHKEKSIIIQKRANILKNNQTKPENQIWYRINKNQLGARFRRQHNIDNKYIVDFICISKKLIIEIDGETHCNNKNDKIRTAYLESLGFKVIRFWNNDIMKNTEACLQVIKRELDLK